jgi:hypothetical protein
MALDVDDLMALDVDDLMALDVDALMAVDRRPSSMLLLVSGPQGGARIQVTSPSRFRHRDVPLLTLC